MLKRRFLTLLTTLALTGLPLSLAYGLNRQEIKPRVEAITVRIQQPDNGQDGGTGILVDREALGTGRYRYTVLTNCHVLKQASSNPDFRQVPFRTGVYTFQVGSQTYQETLTATRAAERCHGEVDLALLYFEANRDYPLAQLGTGAALQSLTDQYVYGAGFPNGNAVTFTRSFTFTERSVVSAVADRAREGYRIRHTAETEVGMSGGPLVNEEAEVIAVLGRAIPEQRGGVPKWNYYGIPISEYTRWQGQPTPTPTPRAMPTPRATSTPTSTPRATSLPLSDRRRYARQITVEISSPSVWGTGVILQRSFQGNQYHYLVLTNDHVMRSATTANLKTADGQTYQGEVVKWPSLEGYDLALLKFTAPYIYSVATFAPLGSVQPWQPVYVAGFPIEPQSQSRPAFDLVEGEVILVAEHTLERGYQVGYHNDTTKGMSGAPVLNGANEVVAIHGLEAFSSSGDPYVYMDGSPPPCEPLWQVMSSLSWGIPVDIIEEVVPPVLTISSPSRFDSLSGTVAPTLAPSSVPNQSQVLANAQSWLSSNSAVYEAGLQVVLPWNNDPSWEDLETRALVTVAQACLPLPTPLPFVRSESN